MFPISKNNDYLKIENKFKINYFIYDLRQTAMVDAYPLPKGITSKLNIIA